MALSTAMGALGAVAAVMLATPALAEPLSPTPPPPSPPVQDGLVQAAGTDPALAPEGVPHIANPDGAPHLASPENLPPGTVSERVAPSQPRLTYLRELWHAMQTQEVSGSDALLLLTQRPMIADATPPRGLPAGPQPPLPPESLPQEPLLPPPPPAP
jgi:resuscitation-promoting factor RpfA